MTYLPYVIAAYAVFAGVLLWDFIVPRMQIRNQLRAVRQRARRGVAAPAPAPEELNR